MGDSWVTIKIKRPEGYEDVHPDLVLQDFMANPSAVWQACAVSEGSESPPPTSGSAMEEIESRIAELEQVLQIRNENVAELEAKLAQADEELKLKHADYTDARHAYQHMRGEVASLTAKLAMAVETLERVRADWGTNDLGIVSSGAIGAVSEALAELRNASDNE